jgi:hypothetical protein
LIKVLGIGNEKFIYTGTYNQFSLFSSFAQLFPTKNLKGILNEIVQLFVSLNKKSQLDFKMGHILFCEKKEI